MSAAKSPAPTTTEGRLVAVETRLEAVETGVSDMKLCLTDIARKLDTALQNKADWEAVTRLTESVAEKALAADLKDVNARLDSRLPVWVTFAFTAGGGAIGALLAALYFVINYYH